MAQMMVDGRVGDLLITNDYNSANFVSVMDLWRR